MSFIKEVEAYLQSATHNPKRISDLCDFVISKLMSIPIPQIVMINLKIIPFQSHLNRKSHLFFQTQILRAFLEYRQANFNEAIEMVKSLDNADYVQYEENTHLSLTKVIYGISYRSLGSRNTALFYLQSVVDKELDLTVAKKYQAFLFGMCLYHIAEMYGEMSKFDIMLDRAEKLLSFSEKIENIDLRNRTLNSIGIAYVGLNDYKQGLKYLKLANDYSQKGVNIPLITRNLNDLGAAYANLEQYDIAISYYRKSLDLRKKTKATSATITTLILMSEIQIKEKRYEEANDLLFQALEIAVPLKVNSKIYKIYKNLSILYERQEQYDKALTYHKRYHDLKENTDNISNVQFENQHFREVNAELRKQRSLVEQQKQQIENSIDKLKETNRYLENFATVAAHDLKAPMRIAANFSQLIEKKYKTLIDEEDVEYFHFITNNISQLGRMIDDLLALSKVDQNLPPPEKVNIHKVVTDVLNNLDTKIKETQAKIRINGELPMLNAHPSLMIQLFQNLIDNAIKYSSFEGNIPSIEIFAKLNLDNSQFYLFEVKDNGKGISNHIQPHIFDLFSGAGEKGGTGIGLATCKKIVKHYGGKIWVESQENVGTSMFFTFPTYVS